MMKGERVAEETLDPQDWDALAELGHRTVDNMLGYLPIEVGCLLVRDPRTLEGAFALGADYITAVQGGILAPSGRFSDRGLQLSRGFRALKIWMSLKEIGTARLARLIRQNVEQARYLAACVDEAQQLQRLAAVPLNAVCFRYRSGGIDEAGLDVLNLRILVALQESGVAVLSHTVLGGRVALRVCITNHRTRREDLDLLVREVVRLGDQLADKARLVSVVAK